MENIKFFHAIQIFWDVPVYHIVDKHLTNWCKKEPYVQQLKKM